MKKLELYETYKKDFLVIINLLNFWRRIRTHKKWHGCLALVFLLWHGNCLLSRNKLEGLTLFAMSVKQRRQASSSASFCHVVCHCIHVLLKAMRVTATWTTTTWTSWWCRAMRTTSWRTTTVGGTATARMITASPRPPPPCPLAALDPTHPHW